MANVLRRGSSVLRPALAAVLAAVYPSLALAQGSADPRAVDRAFDAFWAAENPRLAGQRVDAIVASGVSFEDALARLRKGRPYSAAVPRGPRHFTHRITFARGSEADLSHPYTIVVPEDYDPARAYPVRVQLHGGVGRPLQGRGRGTDQMDRIPGAPDQIYVIPNSWDESMWWEASQADNIAAILDRLRRTYNVDENRVHLTGISDGATGAYFFAFRAPTAFASFLPLNGHMMVLDNPGVRPDGEMFPGNAVNRPFFVVNGGRDRLYPAGGVRPFVEHLESLGTEVVFHVRPDAGHDTSWWPEERPAFEQFVAAHPRDPSRDRLSWETERVDRYNRIDWLVIDELGRVEGETRFPDNNVLDERGRNAEIFSRSGLTGRVDLVRRGNTVDAATEGVRRFTLLLSPAQFDLGQPITVRVNGRVAYQGRVTPSVRSLLEWAARDNDRTALYGAALTIEVAR